MRIGITGAAGFVGSYLTSCLIEKGHHLTHYTRKCLNVLKNICSNSDFSFKIFYLDT